MIAVVPPALSADADVLGIMMEEGRLTAQIPHISISISISAEPAAAAITHENALPELLQKGFVAWKVANPTAGRPKVLYTPRPLNPATGREIGAYLWMTPLALDVHGDVLYEKYASGPRRDRLFSRSEWEQEMRRQVVPVAPQFSHLTQAPLLRAPLPKPKPRSAAVAASGCALELGPRNTEHLISMKSPAELLPALAKWRVGPDTLLNWHGRRLDAHTSRSLLVACAIQAGEDQGLDWLQHHGIGLSGDAFLVAANIHGNLNDADAALILDRWNRLEARGADPLGTIDDATGTYAIVNVTRQQAKHADLESWAAGRAAARPLPARTPAQKQAALVDLFQASRDPMEQRMSWPGMQFFLAAMGESISHVKNERCARLQTLEHARKEALALIREGADPFLKNDTGQRPIDVLAPDQLDLAMVGIDATASFSLMATGNIDRLTGMRKAYGPNMLDFLEAIEVASGVSFLHDGSDALKSQASELVQARPRFR